VSQELTSRCLKGTIFDAFKDISKRESIGVRECAAIDDYASEIDLKSARENDIENHWWEYPEECRRKYFGFALNYNNRDGIVFHLPALMIAEVEDCPDVTDVRDITIYTHLCENVPPNFENKPHHGHSEYLGYLRSVKINSLITYYNFTSAQVNAISLYLLWNMHVDDSSFFQSRESWIAIEKKMHEGSSKYARPGDYTLTFEEAISIVDENHRIVRDWFKAGGVEPEDWKVVKI